MKINVTHKPIFECKSRFMVVFGGAGSGKSVAITQKLLLRIVTEPNHKILIIRKVARTLRDSVFMLLVSLIYDYKLNDVFLINKSNMTIINTLNKSMFLMKGLDDSEKLKSIANITSIWIEEASEITEDDLNELNRRLRGITPHYKQIILSFNPISHLHWLKKRFIDENEINVSVFRTTYKDNKFIDDEYKIELEKMQKYDYQQYRIYALGEWGILDNNLVYHQFKNDAHITNKTIQNFQVLYVGLDFNVGGCVAIIGGIIGDICYIVDSVVGNDTYEVVRKLRALIGGKMCEVCPDSSGRNQTSNSTITDINIIRQNGFMVLAPKANPRVEERISTVNKMFFERKLLINPKVEKLMFSLQTQKRLPNGKPEKFEDHKGGAIDDWCDSLGYLIYTKFGFIQAKTIQKRI